VSLSSLLFFSLSFFFFFFHSFFFFASFFFHLLLGRDIPMIPSPNGGIVQDGSQVNVGLTKTLLFPHANNVVPPEK